MITTSGASVSVLKTAAPGPVRDRLFAQYEWMARHRSDEGVADVHSVHPNGYEMELLTTPVQLPSARTVLALLNANVWGYTPIAQFNMDKHLAYLESLPFGDVLVKRALALSYDNSLWCDTHGDPTFENVMLRGRRPVLTDPLPDRVLSGELPSVRALDIGKVLQSVIGYEYVKSGIITSVDGLEFGTVTNVHILFSREEMELAKFFLQVHIARLIPYQTEAHAALWRSAFEVYFS